MVKYLFYILILIASLFSCQNKKSTYKEEKELNQKKWNEKFNNEGQLVINEFMTNNDGFIVDSQGESSTWIELYNSFSDTIYLNDYYLSNDKKNLKKWRFPKGVFVAPNSFLLVFTSGKDFYRNNELHCNFSILNTREALFLVKKDKIIHSIKGIPLNENQSYGFIPDGGNQGYVQINPSPNKSNLNDVKDIILYSHEGGIYHDTFSLTLKNLNPRHQIYYTIDGKEIDTNAYCYKKPIQLAKVIQGHEKLSDVNMFPPTHEVNVSTPIQSVYSIKAAPFNRNGEKVGPTTTHSYFLEPLGNIHGQLPILSINIPPHNLIDSLNGLFVPGQYWNEENPEWSGNYYQKGKNWEREAFMEFYHPSHDDKVQQTVGVRVHGGNNRRYSQKALRIYARPKYGIPFLNYQFINERPYHLYKQIVLRPFRASWTGAGFENKLSNDLAQGLNIESTPTEPIIVYINGEYWGIYFLEERVNHHYFKSNFNIDRKDLELIGSWNGLVKNGSNKHFNRLVDFIFHNDLSLDENYMQVLSWMDVDNFIDYQILQQFIANYDWPANNMKCWRDRKNNTKWRWVFFDGDGSFGGVYFDSYKHAIGENNQAWSADKQSTLFFKKLMESQHFKNKYLKRSEELFNHHFNYKRTQKIFDTLLHSISPNVEAQILRHDYPESYIKWRDTTNYIDTFLQQRIEKLIPMIGL